MTSALRVDSLTDEDATRQHDPFEVLFHAEHSRVFGVANRILWDADRAEDVTQEVFLQFYRQFRGDETFAPAWLFRAAAHLAFNQARSEARRSRHERRNADLDGTFNASGEDPADITEVQESRILVRRVLQRLPRKHATILALRYSGLTYSEIADSVQCKPSSVGTLLRRAEAAFRKEFERETSS